MIDIQPIITRYFPRAHTLTTGALNTMGQLAFTIEQTTNASIQQHTKHKGVRILKPPVYSDLFVPVRERERERFIISVVAGTHHGTEASPVQQHTNPCTGDMTRRGLFTVRFQIWSQRCAVLPGLVYYVVGSLIVCARCG